MSKQAIEQIKAAEQNAKKIIADAQHQAEAILHDCEKEIVQPPEATSKSLEQRHSAALSEADKKIVIIRRYAEEEARKIEAALKQKYDSLQDEAVELAMAEALK